MKYEHMQEYHPYLIVSQLAIEVVGGSDCRHQVGSLDKDWSEGRAVDPGIDGEIDFMIKTLNVMDPTQSCCFRYVSAMIMSQSSSIKTLQQRKE